MFFVIYVCGSLPHVDIALDENGYALPFDTEEDAEKYAKENCAWDWKVIEF